MPDLVQTIADRTSLYAMDLTSAVQDDLQSLKAAPDSHRLRTEVSAAALLNRRVAAFLEIVTDWKNEMEGFLCKGMTRHDFEIVSRSGSRLIRTCLALAEKVAALWDHLESAGAPGGEVTAGRDALATTRGRMLAVKPWFDHLEKLAARKPPEIDPVLIEKGTEDIRQGRFVTGEQLLKSIRDRAS